ncbi:MAG TPA: hypothetical protein PKC28_10525 [Bdellovibrionales bacterium]|nr:hypothetical protein [Bdellovibrionales bacterium]
MDFDDPLVGAYGILLVGSQVTYFGMKFNGSASPRNPVWLMVDWFHSIITYGSLAVVGFFIFTEFLWPLGCLLTGEISKYLERPKGLKPTPPPKMEYTPEQREEYQKQRQERLEYLRQKNEQVMEEMCCPGSFVTNLG